MEKIKILQSISYNYIQIGISLGISLGFALFFMLIKKPVIDIIFKVLGKAATKTRTDLDDKLLVVIKSPLKLLVTFTIFYVSYKLFDMKLIFSEQMILKSDLLVFQIYRSIVLIFFFLVMYNSAGESQVLFGELEEVFDIKIDKLLIPFISKVFRLIIVVMGIGGIASEWGYNVTGFITGLGIGGLAFALAAKDTLANAFGGAVLITEKPFTIGDWIVVDGVEGTVEDISFRSTKIRKFNKSVVTVPNSIVAISNIINYSKRDLRRVSFELKIRVNTPVNKIKTVVSEINQMLKEHSGIDNETIFVKFNKFGESSYKIFLYYFTNTSVWEEYLDYTEDTNYKIIEILEKNNVELAVPMQIVKVEKDVE